MTAVPCVLTPEPYALPDADCERWRYVADAFRPSARDATAEASHVPAPLLPRNVVVLTFGEDGRLTLEDGSLTLRDAPASEAEGVRLTVLEREEAAALFPRAGSAGPAVQAFYGPAPSCAYRLHVAPLPGGLTRRVAVVRRAEGGADVAFALAVDLAPGARLDLHERYLPAERAGGARPSPLIFSSLAASLGAGASLDLSSTLCGFPEARICAAERADVGAGAVFRRHVTALGGRAFKLETSAYLTGETASAEYRAALFGDGDRFADVSPFMYHRAPRTESFVSVRQLLQGRARGVFYGLADVPEDAPGSRAEQRHRCLLASDRAKAYARPQLDIRTNDVTCCHGSATGGPDPDALFYLRSRGFDEQEAAHLLAEAFLAPSAADLPDPEAREAQAELIRAALRRAAPAQPPFVVPGHE